MVKGGLHTSYWNVCASLYTYKMSAWTFNQGYTVVTTIKVAAETGSL